MKLNENITFGELKTMLKIVKKRTLPTVKQLRESNIPVVAGAEIGNVFMTVYETGFAVYEAQNRATVLDIAKCRDYSYSMCNLSEDYFNNRSWVLRLMLAGEDRLEHNSESRDVSNKPDKACQLGMAMNAEQDSSLDTETLTVSQENFSYLISCLTEHQQKIMRLYWEQGYTHQEIADTLKVGRRTITTIIDRCVKKIRKNF